MSLRSYLLSGCIAFVLYGPALATAVQAQSTQDNAGTQPGQSRLLVNVVHKDSRFVGPLHSEDLRVMVDGKPQEIIAFQKLDNQPLAIAIMIDTSLSQQGTLPSQKRAAEAFVDAIMRPEKDQAAIVTFTGAQTVEQAFTSDVSLLRQAISGAKVVVPSGYIAGGVLVAGIPSKKSSEQLAGSTALWDALWETSGELFRSTPAGAIRAIILLSDGVDTSSRAKLRDAIEVTAENHVEVYAIGIGDASLGGVDREDLLKLSDKTGGRAFFPKKTEDLTEIFAQIQQALRSRYEITYRSPASKAGSPAKVKVEITNPALRSKDLRISSRRLSLSQEK